MNVILPQEPKISNKQKLIYVISACVCIISIIVAFYVQFYARINIAELFGITTETSFGKKTEEEKAVLKSEFDGIFDNSVKNVSEQNNDKRADINKELVYTEFEKKDSKSNSYEIEVHIPYININNLIVNDYNKKIEEFKHKTENIIASQNRNIIYTVDYVANIEEDILSVMIRSNLKEGANAQRIIIQTYNYDLRNNKEINLEEVLKIKNISIDLAQNNINDEIEKAQKNVEDLKEVGYTIYNRDIKNKIYKIENSTEFYIDGNTLYVVYAYGNNSLTSEMDLVIF